MNTTDKRIHITPDDVLADIDEIMDGSDPRSRCKYFIEPYEPTGINEVCEANYFMGHSVPYHEHKAGFETFLVDGGAIDIMFCSKKAAAHKGDIVHIMPCSPHAIRALEDNSIWRAFHQGLWFVDMMINEQALRDRHWDAPFTAEFRKDISIRHGSNWFDYGLPECRDVSAGELPGLRPFDYAISEYAFDGISLKLKVGRWETMGVKEVWQLRLAPGFCFSWGEVNPFTLLYDVFSGSVRVTLEGMEPFTANARDLIHIPKYLAGKIEALGDVVLFDAGCQGFLTRFMDELYVVKAKRPSELKDASKLRELMNKNDYHIFFENL